MACATENIDIIRLLFDRGANTEATAHGALKALHVACVNGNGNSEVVGLLLDRGANINSREDSGLSSLHITSQLSFCDVFELLLDRCADTEVRTDGNDITPLFFS
jgi:ankyrin repeat protein